MEVRSITSDPEMRSFRIRQTIETSYRDLPEATSISSMLVEAQRDPPGVQTTLDTGDGSTIVTLMIDNGLWTRTGEDWTRSDVGDVPDDWTRRAYREIGDMSLVAPLSAQAVIDASGPGGAEEIRSRTTARFHAGSDVMIQLATDAFEAGRHARDTAPPPDEPPPDNYMNRYEADLWVDPMTGFVIRERTVVEYTEERLHGQQIGTGPATFKTTREFFDFNTAISLTRPAG